MNRVNLNITEDPTKDVQELFEQLDNKFFQSKLKKGGVLLEWCDKASSTAGYCYQLNDSVKQTKRCYIVLNKPLLMLRTREDLVDTLLHEMIHAMLNIEGIEERNGGHGPNFCRIMKSINKVAGTRITVYHKFHDEVDHCKDLSGLKKKAPAKPMVKPNPLLKPYVEPARPRSPYRPGLPPSMQSKRYKALTEIYDFYKNRIDHNAVKLIGYDSESDLSDYDSDDSDYESKCPDRGVAEWMRHTRNLRDVAPWIRSVSYRR